jgi:hypothetical protein
MEGTRPTCSGVIALIALCLLVTSVALHAQEAGPLAVETATICQDVLDLEPVGMGTVFPASVGKLYYFTKIVHANPPTEVTHVWYYGDTEKARVTLRVNSTSWRTYSSKIIQFRETGVWYVDVLGPDGNRLTSTTFEVTP